MRKEAGFSINDLAELYYSDNDKLNEVFDKFGQDILQGVLSVGYKTADMDQIKLRKEIIINKEKILIGIKAVNIK